MRLNKSIKQFQRDLARWGLKSFYLIFSILPYWLSKGIAYVLVGIGYMLVIKQKKIARKTLAIAFKKEKSQDEINRIMRGCFANMGFGMVEMLYFLTHPSRVNSKITIEGKEYLDQAIKKNKGVIAVTAHFGNFPLMMLYYALGGYKPNTIIRPARDSKVEEFLLGKRKACGLNTIYALPRQKCVTQCIKALRDGELLFMPMDQNFGSGSGVFVEFFGQKAATATGPVTFARRTKAPVIPMFIVRENSDHHKIIIEPPLKLDESGEEDEMVRVNTAKITSLIEQYIRRYPTEWGWMHNRWKSRPLSRRYLPNC